MSIIRNSSKLFSDYEDTVNKTLSFVHGARVWFTLALTWINLWVYSSVFIPTPNGKLRTWFGDLLDFLLSCLSCDHGRFMMNLMNDFWMH